MDVLLDHLDDAGVHHLQRGRHDPGGDDARHGGGRVVHGREVGEQGRQARRYRGEADGDAGGDPHRPLAADERPPQVEAVGLGVDPAEQGHRTVGQHDLEGQHVGAGDAVQKAVRSARIVGHIATDRAGLLTRGVWGEMESQMGYCSRQVEVQHSGLHPGQALVGVDLQDGVHLGGDDHHRRDVARGGRPAGQPGARPAWDERPSVGTAHPDGGGHLGRAQREAYDRGLPRDHRGVAPVQSELYGIGPDPVRGQSGPEVGDQLLAGLHVGHWFSVWPKPALCAPIRPGRTRPARPAPIPFSYSGSGFRWRGESGPPSTCRRRP